MTGKVNGTVATAFCTCGKPLRHMGRCKGGGYPSVSPGRSGAVAVLKTTKRAKFRAAIEAQVKTTHDTIAQLKAEMRERQQRLAEAEAELAPLRTLLGVYSDLALPAPVAPPPVTPAVTASPTVAPGTPPARPASVPRVVAEAGVAIGADLAAIENWARQRGLACERWDDLPAVNRKRESLGLAPFKRPSFANGRRDVNA